MKKSLLALAVAAALPAAAQAQSTITMYGIMDVGVEYSNDQANGYINTATGQAYVGDSGFRVSNGIQTGSRLGFRGVENLGGGMSALFTIEHRLSPDTGTQTDSSKFWNAQAWVGLGTSFGTLMLGRQYTPIFWAMLPMDFTGYHFYNNWAGYTPNSPSGALQTAFTPQGAIRWDNAIQYKSPTFAGLTVYAAYAPGEKLTLTSVPVAGNCATTPAGCFGKGDAYGISAGWKMGVFSLAGGYHKYDNKNTNLSTQYTFTNTDVWMVAAGLDFGKFGINGAYSQLKFDQTYAGVVINPEINNILGSAYLALGPGKVYLNVHYNDPKNWRAGSTFSGDAMLQVGATYAWFLSNRTTLYASVGYNDWSGIQPQVANTTTLDNMLRVGLGINHKF